MTMVGPAKHLSPEHQWAARPSVVGWNGAGIAPRYGLYARIDRMFAHAWVAEEEAKKRHAMEIDETDETRKRQAAEIDEIWRSAKQPRPSW